MTTKSKIAATFVLLITTTTHSQNILVQSQQVWLPTATQDLDKSNHPPILSLKKGIIAKINNYITLANVEELVKFRNLLNGLSLTSEEKLKNFNEMVESSLYTKGYCISPNDSDGAQKSMLIIYTDPDKLKSTKEQVNEEINGILIASDIDDLYKLGSLLDAFEGFKNLYDEAFKMLISPTQCNPGSDIKSTKPQCLISELKRK